MRIFGFSWAKPAGAAIVKKANPYVNVSHAKRRQLLICAIVITS